MSVVNGCLAALAQFPPEGTSEKSDECYRLIREGVVNSTSIGFIPVEWEFLDKNRPVRLRDICIDGGPRPPGIYHRIGT
jgi:hypothetical protein